MFSLTHLIAWRYITGTRHAGTISTMAVISFISILIGSFALALIMCVMNGFEKTTYQKIQTMHAPIIINSHGQSLNIPALAKVITQEFPQISSWSARARNHVMIQENDDSIDNVMILSAIDPEHESQVSTIEQTIVAWHTQTNKLADILQDSNILIGRKNACQLGLELGDTIDLLYTPEGALGKKIILEKKSAIIGGLFDTGVDEFDTGMIVCSLNFFNKLFPDQGISLIGVKLSDTGNEQQTIAALHARLKLDVYSWKTLYPALVSALMLEKYAMFFILALICLVASMNIISLLFMHITQKRGDIAILKAHGLSDAGIRTIFLWMGMGIAGIAALMGIIFAYGAGLLLEKYPFIQLPDVYYVSHLPINMEPTIFIFVFLVVMFLSLIATLIPIRTTKTINIANVLRHEA